MVLRQAQAFKGLEVGEVSEDEEENGEYQKERLDEKGDKAFVDIWKSDGHVALSETMTMEPAQVKGAVTTLVAKFTIKTKVMKR